MARTNAQDGRDNRKKIVDTAIRIIGDKGVEKTSLAEIAREAGLSKGTLYYYFSSKNELIFDIAAVHMEEISSAIFAMIDTDREEVTWEELLTVLLKSLLSSKQRGRFHLYLLREAISGKPSLKMRFQETYYQWFSMINNAYKLMGREGFDLDLKARILVAVLDGLIIQALLDIEQTPIDLLVKHFLNLIDP